MKKLYLILMLMLVTSLAAAQCGSAPVPAPAEESGSPEIKVMEPFARASMPNGAVYMHLMNEGSADDRLISAESDVAEAVELHETKMDENDVMQMSPIEAVDLPAGASETLEPGGKHVMLLGLTEELATGDSFELTLNFENSGPQTIQVEVKEGMRMDHSMEEDEMEEMDTEHAEDEMQ
jgi:copper(I)-binding protein